MEVLYVLVYVMILALGAFAISRSRMGPLFVAALQRWFRDISRGLQNAYHWAVPDTFSPSGKPIRSPRSREIQQRIDKPSYGDLEAGWDPEVWVRENSQQDLILAAEERALVLEANGAPVEPIKTDWLPRVRGIKDCDNCTWFKDQDGFHRTKLCSDHTACTCPPDEEWPSAKCQKSAHREERQKIEGEKYRAAVRREQEQEQEKVEQSRNCVDCDVYLIHTGESPQEFFHVDYCNRHDPYRRHMPKSPESLRITLITRSMELLASRDGKSDDEWTNLAELHDQREVLIEDAARAQGRLGSWLHAQNSFKKASLNLMHARREGESMKDVLPTIEASYAACERRLKNLEEEIIDNA